MYSLLIKNATVIDGTGKAPHLADVAVNGDENPDLTSRFNVMSIPTMKFFKNGEVVGELVGAAPKNTIEAEIHKHAA